MPKKPESRFKERVARDLKTLTHTWFVKIQQVAIRGIPDFLVCIRGRFIAIELKSTPKSVVSPLQEWTLKEIARCDGIALITYPSNWADTFLLLQEIANDGEEEVEFEVDDPETRIIQVDWEKVSRKVKN